MPRGQHIVALDKTKCEKPKVIKNESRRDKMFYIIIYEKYL